MIGLTRIPAEQLFEYPTDIGHGRRCDMCGTKLHDARRCSECGYSYETEHQVSGNAHFGSDGFRGVMEALL
jgi:hypothetical protein